MLLTFAIVPLMFVTGHTSYVLLAGGLFVRGIGLGAAVQPSAAAAYQLLHSGQVPRATASLNTLRQIGGAIGTTLLAVVLQHEAATAVSSSGSSPRGLLSPLPNAERIRVIGPVANAFDRTFLWALVIALVTIIPAAVLVHVERRNQRHGPTTTANTGAAVPPGPRCLSP